KGVHLLGHDVGFLADAPHKQFGRFENRSANLTESIEMECFPKAAFQRVPDSRIGGKNVIRAANRVNHAAASLSFPNTFPYSRNIGANTRQCSRLLPPSAAA